MQIEMQRRPLFESELLQAVYVRARAASAAPGQVERQDSNVVVLPLAGVFAKHDGPRRHALATPEHATLIARHTPYRISLPGAVGDECLTLRFSPDALARVAPQVMRSERFDMARFRSQVLLPVRLALARSVLWRCCSSGTGDALRIEELGVGVLLGTLALARERALQDTSALQRRRVARVIEAVSLDPARKWTLASLAELAGISPWHLAHGFRAATGLSLYRYVLHARLSRTLPAVLESDAELASIALDAGFSSHSHFTARFHALFGWTPHVLRRHANGRIARELSKIVTAHVEVGV